MENPRPADPFLRLMGMTVPIFLVLLAWTAVVILVPAAKLLPLSPEPAALALGKV